MRRMRKKEKCLSWYHSVTEQLVHRSCPIEEAKTTSKSNEHKQNNAVHTRVNEKHVDRIVAKRIMVVHVQIFILDRSLSSLDSSQSSYRRIAILNQIVFDHSRYLTNQSECRSICRHAAAHSKRTFMGKTSAFINRYSSSLWYNCPMPSLFLTF